jgi:DNA repair photolyase
MLNQATLPLLFVLSPTLQPDRGEALERRLRKAVRRREPVVLGTAAEPYEPAIGPRASHPLRVLLSAEGLQIAVTTRTAGILRELDLLVELDRRHAVDVRMVVPGTESLEPRMRAVSGLAAEGIATTVLFSPAAPADFKREESFRYLLEEALAAGAADVEIDPRFLRRGERSLLAVAFRRLRLEYGFPRGGSGRG